MFVSQKIATFDVGKINKTSNMKIATAQTLKDRILSQADNTILFRSDFPDYHQESVGRVLSALSEDGVLLRLAQGVYVKPRLSRFGPILPSVDHVAEAVALRDHAEILPCGETAMNLLGLSTQVPVSDTYITTGSSRVLQVGNRRLEFKQAAPRNFVYHTKLAALLVQALRAMGEKNVGEEELAHIQSISLREKDKKALLADIMKMPGWMKRKLSDIAKQLEHETVD